MVCNYQQNPRKLRSLLKKPGVIFEGIVFFKVINQCATQCGWFGSLATLPTLSCEVDIEADSVLPTTARIRAVGDNVAATVVLACQKVNREKMGKDMDSG